MKTADSILRSFFETQRSEGERLARESDALSLDILPEENGDGSPIAPLRALARFDARCLVREVSSGEVIPWHGYQVGISFLSDYLIHVDPLQVVSWLWPPHVYLPNVRFPFCCVGRIRPGTPLVDLLYQVHEIAGGHRMTTIESDALNPEACAWARGHRECFPVERRALRRSAGRFRVEEVSHGAK